jgi:hypothetical protein
MAFADLVPSEVQNKITGTELLQTNGTWTPYTSAQDTLRFLAINQLNSYRAILENCRIISEAQKLWSGRNEVTTWETQEGKFVAKRTDDWSRFRKALRDNFGLTDSGLTSMTKIWKNYDEGGSLKKVLETTNLLPNSQTALYEISTIDESTKDGQQILDTISMEMKRDTNVTLNDIRHIKKTKGITAIPVSKAKEVNSLMTTKLNLPKGDDDLKRLQKDWSKIEEALKKINDLGIIKIVFDNPKSIIEKKKAQESEKEVTKLLTDWKRFIRKNHVVRLGTQELLDMKITKESKNRDNDGEPKELTKADEEFNSRMDRFVSKFEDVAIAEEMARYLNEWNEELKTSAEKAKKQNEEFSLLSFKEHLAIQEMTEHNGDDGGMSTDSLKNVLKARN